MSIHPHRITALVVMFAAAAGAQINQSLQDRGEIPEFSFDALAFAGDDSATSRLDVYVQVPFDALRFVQDGNTYRASYEETISIYDANDNLVVEKFAVERIPVAMFQETVDPAKHHLTQRFFTLKPGKYTIVVQVRDEETRKFSRNKRTIVIRSMRDEMLTMSDIMLVSRLQEVGETKTILPNISGNVGNLPDGFFLFSEVYNNTDSDSLEITLNVRNAKNENVIKELISRPAVRGKNPIFTKINSGHLAMGRYLATLQAVAFSSSSEARYTTSLVSHPFVVRWVGIAVSIEDLDLAIDQLMYKAESDEIEYMRSAPSMEEKKKRFFEFWKKFDPNPLTERNEAMEEYYNRVAVANQQFSHYREGWKSDRGMVYIMFGPPNSVDRYPFEGYSKPYEIWHYHELNYRFLFVDQTGFGDYRLDPSTPIWNIKPRRQ